MVRSTQAPPQLPPAHTQSPDPLQKPPVGVEQPPAVRGVALHTTAPPEQVVVPLCWHPPVPAEVHDVPTVTHAPPQRT